MKKIGVLIVEDSDVVRQLLEHIIGSDSRFQVLASVPSAEAALEVLHRVSPDVISLDIRLPGMNGFEATRQIKSRPNPPRIVMLTSHDIAHYRTAAEDAGADNFVNKADFGTELLPLIDNVLAERAATES